MQTWLVARRLVKAQAQWTQRLVSSPEPFQVMATHDTDDEVTIRLRRTAQSSAQSETTLPLIESVFPDFTGHIVNRCRTAPRCSSRSSAAWAARASASGPLRGALRGTGDRAGSSREPVRDRTPPSFRKRTRAAEQATRQLQHPLTAASRRSLRSHECEDPWL